MERCAGLLRDQWPGICFSSVFRCSPQEEVNQPPFLNAVAHIDTEDDPGTIFQKTQVIERALKKDVPYRYGPRTIDLDLLLYDETAPEAPGIVLPHPKMGERRFVLEPLCELTDDPQWHEKLKKTLDQSCERTDIVL
jgi:2-amino-4-hydroxy-6-hydroxymethyldihydropteridine diphosphokinase